ncbi:glucoamylase [Halostella sp. JP-L12]|uniref:glucodextranase DOMON-like domain-containing protein n=1 Tax=Halostella TaxID=1843185 RepID=UPI000EF77DEF|nr:MULTISPECIES: glucodextranase DOMON-like domain-containing protein [Halostella]NHN45985.1 glucoamylase [Halostella sp. JP-L12]
MKALGAGVGASLVGVPAAARPPDAEGEDAYWTTGEQYGAGTVRDHGADDPSRVWFTLSEGALTGARFPRVDLMNLRTLEFVVAQPDSGYVARTFEADRTAESTIERTTEPAREDALVFEQTVSDADRRWELTVEYAADPENDALLADVRFRSRGPETYDVYAVADTALSNSGRGDAASVVDDGGGNALVAHDKGENDDAVVLDEDGESYDIAAAMTARRGFDWASVDVAGGDAVGALLADGAPADSYEDASGNVALLGRLGEGASAVDDTVSLGFAEAGDTEAALAAAGDAHRKGFGGIRAAYARTWREYLDSLDVPDAVRGDPDLREQYRFAAMVVKAVEDKTFAGAGIASPSVPWGEAVEANEPSDYGYNYVWSRDLYQSFTALEAMGDVESAADAVEYLYGYQQDDDGFLPQNTFLDGRTRWGGEQMDNVSFPQVMAYQLKERHGYGFEEAGYGYENVRRSADYVVANGPDSGQERWEEESGYSPSTIAAEIAGLAAAAKLADGEGERADALAYLALADDWTERVEDWTATEAGTDEHGETPYYVRVTGDGDPNDDDERSLANGGPTLDERNIVDAGFLELVRLGVKSADDEVVRNSLSVVDDAIRVETPHGPAWYRYNGDGYGEQGEGDEHPAGAPWSLDNEGKGRLWPIFTGERAEYELRAGDAGTDLDPGSLLETMAGFANSGRMIPEQVWDREDPTDYGWEFGEGTGSATPLVWSMAQYVRLAHALDVGEPVETPALVRERYAGGERPEGPSLSVEFPGEVVSERTVTVTGTTDGAEVVAKTATGTVRAEPTDGEFSLDVTVGDGEATITVVAATDGDDVSDVGTTVRRSTVAYVDLGEEVAAWDDPAGDDHGPGSYTYPTAAEFVDGAFDVASFEVYETDDAYQFLYRLAGDLTNPWGGDELSLQTFQVYFRDPAADGGTTDAREGVRASFEAPYQRRLVVEGFEPPRVEAADGSTVSDDVSVTGYQSVDAVKIEVPKAAVGSLAELSPLLLGQDGWGPGRIRTVDADRADYAFGGGRDDDANPNVIDLVTPEGVDQSEALAYTADERATIPYLSLER